MQISSCCLNFCLYLNCGYVDFTLFFFQHVFHVIQTNDVTNQVANLFSKVYVCHLLFSCAVD